MNLKKLAFLICLVSCTVLHAQNVAINTDGSAADPSAALHVKSNNKGVLIPTMTLSLRDAITTPATGLLIYQSDGSSGFYFNAGTPAAPNWKQLSTDAITTTGSIGQTLRHNGTSWEANNNLFNNPTDNNIGIGITNPSANLHVVNTGTDRAGLFSISNPANANYALEVNTDGTAPAVGFFGGVYIRGKGSTTSTEALKVENTAGTVLLSLNDAGNATVNGFTKLGVAANAVAIKMIKLTGTTASTEGGSTTLNHGLNSAKILDVSVLVDYCSCNSYVPAHYMVNPDYEFDYYFDSSTLNIINKTNNSLNILSRPFKVLITYEQ